MSDGPGDGDGPAWGWLSREPRAAPPPPPSYALLFPISNDVGTWILWPLWVLAKGPGSTCFWVGMRAVCVWLWLAAYSRSQGGANRLMRGRQEGPFVVSGSLSARCPIRVAEQGSSREINTKVIAKDCAHANSGDAPPEITQVFVSRIKKSNVCVRGTTNQPEPS